MNDRKILRAFPGMTMEQAVELIHRRGKRWHEAPVSLPPRSNRGRSPLDITKSSTRPLLEMTLRDCAWCITHSNGDIHKLYNAVLKGTRQPYREDISDVMNHAFHGIGGWLA